MAVKIKSDDDVRALHEMYWGVSTRGDGMTLLDLSLDYGFSPQTIRKHFNRLGLPIRPAHTRVHERRTINQAPSSSEPAIRRSSLRGTNGKRRRGRL